MFCFFQKNVIIPCKIKIVCCFSNVSGVNNKTLVQPQCSTVTWTLNIRLLIYCEWNFWQEEHMSVVFFIYLFTLAVFFCMCIKIYLLYSFELATRCLLARPLCPYAPHGDPVGDTTTSTAHYLIWTPSAADNQLLDTRSVFKPTHTKKNPCNSSMCLCKGWFLQDCKRSSDCHQMSKTCCVEF